MSSPVEYLFAATLSVAEQAARKQGWHPHGRSGWIKPDGNEVYFICCAEQLAAIPAGATVYVVGARTPPQTVLYAGRAYNVMPHHRGRSFDILVLAFLHSPDRPHPVKLED